MRLAYERTAGAGYPADDWLAFTNQASGGDWSDFFRRHVSGTEEFPYERVLGYAGIRYEAKDEGPEADAGFDAHGIGEDLVRVSRVREKSPAAEAGLMDGDILLSSEGRRLRAGTFWGWLRAKKPGDKVTFTLFRGERALEKTVSMGERRRITHVVQLIEKPNDAQKTILNGWLK
jgi:predicted metalloprotease with PDZ domain